MRPVDPVMSREGVVVQRIMVVIVLLVACITANVPYALGVSTCQVADATSCERFHFTNGLTGIQHIYAWLKSFRELTRITADRITPEEKVQVGNLGADMQSISFYNWTKSVEGTLHKQNYDICRLEYELALEKLATGKTSQAEVNEKEKRYQEASKDMQDFLSKFHVAD